MIKWSLLVTYCHILKFLSDPSEFSPTMYVRTKCRAVILASEAGEGGDDVDEEEDEGDEKVEQQGGFTDDEARRDDCSTG